MVDGGVGQEQLLSVGEDTEATRVGLHDTGQLGDDSVCVTMLRIIQRQDLLLGLI